MTSPERREKLAEMRQEFEAESTTDERRIEILLQVREWGEEEMPESHCLVCRHLGLFVPYHKALIEGHCYSEAGLRDYRRITHVCEFCFDKMHEEIDE